MSLNDEQFGVTTDRQIPAFSEVWNPHHKHDLLTISLRSESQSFLPQAPKYTSHHLFFF